MGMGSILWAETKANLTRRTKTICDGLTQRTSKPYRQAVITLSNRLKQKPPGLRHLKFRGLKMIISMSSIVSLLVPILILGHSGRGQAMYLMAHSCTSHLLETTTLG